MREHKEFNYTSGITHAGKFHADEVFTTAAIELFYDPDFEVRRVLRVPDDLPTDVFVYDIGLGEYDHHQNDSSKVRENGIPYSSFGLFWRDFCPLSYYVWQAVDTVLVQAIDAVDNGIFPNSDIAPIVSVSNVIARFNLNWDAIQSEEEINNAFYSAVDVAKVILQNEIKFAESKEKAMNDVMDSIRKATGHILILDHYAPWQEFVINSPEADDILFTIFPSNRGGWCVSTVPKSFSSGEKRLDLCKEWGGKTAAELQEITGIETFNFCHKSLFLASTGTLNDAVKVAELAIDKRSITDKMSVF